MRDIEIGIGTCLTVFLTKVTYLLSDRTETEMLSLKISVGTNSDFGTNTNTE